MVEISRRISNSLPLAAVTRFEGRVDGAKKKRWWFVNPIRNRKELFHEKFCAV
jgi:hypothetical protein